MNTVVKRIFLLTLTLGLCLFSRSNLQAGGLNYPAGTHGEVCHASDLRTLNDAITLGYNVNDPDLPSFCKTKIVFTRAGTITLNRTLNFDNPITEGFTLVKASDVSGEVILDASNLPANRCAINLATNRVTVQGITIINAAKAGICIKNNTSGHTIKNIRVSRSNTGVIVEAGSSNSKIRNNEFSYNKVGVQLLGADRNLVSPNRIFNNETAAVLSVREDIKPIIESASPTNVASTEYQITGTVAGLVASIEVYRDKEPSTATDPNLIATISGTDLTSGAGDDMTFVKSITGVTRGEKIFLIGIAPDDSTSPSSNLLTLGSGSSVTPGNPNPGDPNPGIRPCRDGQVFQETADWDHDGIPDYLEDRNKNCIVDTDDAGKAETDPSSTDTDGDAIVDGLEDLNKNGQVDENESDPTSIDTDEDRIMDVKEDVNKNGRRDPGECHPNKKDTDGDGIFDDREDLNQNGLQDTEDSNGDGVLGPQEDLNQNHLLDIIETSCVMDNSDTDGIKDGIEDKNHNGVVDAGESDPRVGDTDQDGMLDDAAEERCPLDNHILCKVPCRPGVVMMDPNQPDQELDTDGDERSDHQECPDLTCDSTTCVTDPYDPDSDNDGTLDGADICPRDQGNECPRDCRLLQNDPTGDADQDDLSNAEEDTNGNCVLDANETDPLLYDTDGDDLSDKDDPCPRNADRACEYQCKAGQEAPEGLDSDGDGIDDRYEDINKNCLCDVVAVGQATESCYSNPDTDGDGKQDNTDPCVLNPDEDDNQDGAISEAEICREECQQRLIVPGRDSDNDGLDDLCEDKDADCRQDANEMGAYNADSDADGIVDGTEDRNQSCSKDADETDPLASDSDGDDIDDGIEDADQDGRLDAGELNPVSKDSDSDEIPDYLEDTNRNGSFDQGETIASQPDGRDTDRDGIPDGEEDKNHNGRFDLGETDPRNSDTDADGVSDGIEVDQNTDPIRANPDDRRIAEGLGTSGCALSPVTVGGANSLGLLIVGMFGLLGLRLRRLYCRGRF